MRCRFRKLTQRNQAAKVKTKDLHYMMYSSWRKIRFSQIDEKKYQLRDQRRKKNREQFTSLASLCSMSLFR